MARIDFDFDGSRTPKPVDFDIDEDQRAGYPGRRHVWIEIPDADGGEIRLSLGMPTDEQVIERTGLLIDALTELRSEARYRIASRESVEAAPA